MHQQYKYYNIKCNTITVNGIIFLVFTRLMYVIFRQHFQCMKSTRNKSILHGGIATYEKD